MKVRFWNSDKPRERLLGEAFITGVRAFGDQADMRSLGDEITPDCDVAVMVGVKSRELWRAHQRMGVQLVYLDKGYSRHDRGDGSRVWEYWRCAVNSHHPTVKYRKTFPSDRLDDMGWQFKPWRKSGKHILIAGSSQKYHDFYDLKPPTEWTQKLVKIIDKMTDREIVYRPKPSYKDAQPVPRTTFHQEGYKIEDDLRDCHVMITHGSNACFEALLAGVPSIILGEGVTKPISSTHLNDLEAPTLASDDERKQLLAFLAYHQWTMEEMHDGLAWPVIRREIFQ